jgi:acyl phosphate:glycerol-3-phosphate acyltransferase
MLFTLSVIAIAYLIGAIPTGYLLCLWCYGIDITNHGSGNIGASNVARVMGNKLFPVVFCIDAGKAYAPLWLVSLSGYGGASVLYGVALALLVGNAYSLFIGFRGGRGVATAMGIVGFFLPWTSTIGCMVVWIAMLAVTRKPFMASMSAFIGVMVIHVLMQTAYVPLLVGISLWIGWRHSSHLWTWYCTLWTSFD